MNLQVLAALSLLALPLASQGQEGDAQSATDLAIKTTTTYLAHIAAKDWEAAGSLVKPTALKRQHHDYATRVRRAPTIDEEEMMLQRLGLERLRELEDMTPLQFYITMRDSSEKANQLTPATKERMRESFKAEVVGAIAEEDRGLVHVLTRTSHQTLDTAISEIIYLTLEKTEEGTWLIAPEHQKMSLRPLVTGELPEGLMERIKERAEEAKAAEGATKAAP